MVVDMGGACRAGGSPQLRVLRNQAMVRRSPSSNGDRGSQPSARPGQRDVGLAHRRVVLGPGDEHDLRRRAGRARGSSSASSSTDSSCGLPMLTGPGEVGVQQPAGCPRPGRRRSRRERVWVPSPATVIGSPRSAWRTKVGMARPSSGPHPRAVGVEDPHDAGVDAVGPAVGHGHRLGEPLGLVVDPARADRVDVAPVGLRLRVDLRVAVRLRGGGEQEARALLPGQPERVQRADRADLQRLDRQLQVVDRRGGRGEVQDGVDRPRRRAA